MVRLGIEWLNWAIQVRAAAGERRQERTANM